MSKECFNQGKLHAFETFLISEERSAATIAKYARDVKRFLDFVKGNRVDRDAVLSYKQMLGAQYATLSANSMLAALNSFLRFCGKRDLCVKQFRVQRAAFSPEEKELTKEEYRRLVETAHLQHNERLWLLLQTICGTGIRVSELPFITVEAATRGEASVVCKGKTRKIFIVERLRRHLLRFAKKQKITHGAIFVTKSGKTMDRSNIWREMKALCREAGVSEKKVFPHNLRHLFARTFYGIEKDIAKLADVLGHSSIETTRIYIATSGAEHRRRMENMHLIC